MYYALLIQRAIQRNTNIELHPQSNVATVHDQSITRHLEQLLLAQFFDYSTNDLDVPHNGIILHTTLYMISHLHGHAHCVYIDLMKWTLLMLSLCLALSLPDAITWNSRLSVCAKCLWNRLNTNWSIGGTYRVMTQWLLPVVVLWKRRLCRRWMWLRRLQRTAATRPASGSPCIDDVNNCIRNWNRCTNDTRCDRTICCNSSARSRPCPIDWRKNKVVNVGSLMFWNTI